MRFTRFGFYGLVFYLLMVGAYFLSPYSNLFFLLLGFLTILALSGVWGAVRNLRGLEAEVGELRPVAADTGIELNVELLADRHTRFQVDVILELEQGTDIRGRADLVEDRSRVELRSKGLARGLYRIERARVASNHPLGFMSLYRSIEAPLELVVYPAPLGLEGGRSANTLLDELLGVGDPGAGDLQPAGLRDHREEDGVRGIHWRASARRGQLVVQEWEGGSGQGIEVVLDRRCAPAALEEALRSISAMVHLARTNKETLRLHSQELSATFGEGHQPWSEVLRFLAAAHVLPGDAPAPPVTSPSVLRLPRDVHGGSPASSRASGGAIHV